MMIHDPFVQKQLKSILWYKVLITQISLVVLTFFLKDYTFQLIYYIPIFLFSSVLNIEFYSNYTIEIENMLALPVTIEDMVHSRINGVICNALIQLSFMYVIYIIKYSLYYKNVFIVAGEIIVHIALFFVLKQAGKSIVYLLFSKGKKTFTVSIIKILLYLAIGIMSVFGYKMIILPIIGIVLFLLNKKLIKNIDNEKILINGGV